MMVNPARAPRAAGIAAGLLAATLVFSPLSAATPPESFAPLVDQVKGAVVNISTTAIQPNAGARQLPGLPGFPPGSPFEEFFRQFREGMPQQPQRRPGHALGSGFIIDASGIVVTNNHVVENGTDIKVTLQGGVTLDATLLGTDPKTDLAVLKVNTDKPLPFVSFGDSDSARVGDWVIAVGNPFGLGGTVTAGIVSARARDIGAGPYDDFLQVDASINPGNSGGPTFNAKGEVIGINTAIFSPNGGGNVGIGFAIPSNLARPIIAQLQRGERIERGWIGVSVQPVTPEIAQALGAEAKGALVADVSANGPAQKAGLRSGDVITAVDGRAVTAMRDLPRLVAGVKPGTAARFDVLRDGKVLQLPVTVAEAPDQRRTAQAAPDKAPKGRLGLQLAPVDERLRAQFDLPADRSGAAIVAVAPDSPAARSNLQPGDVIVKVNGSDVASPQEVVKAVEEAAGKQRKAVALLVLHKGQPLYVAVPLT